MALSLKYEPAMDLLSDLITTDTTDPLTADPSWPIPSLTTTIADENVTIQIAAIDPYLSSLYRKVVPVMLIFCAVSVVINVIMVIAATRWIRRTLSTTLMLSVSLAAADAMSSFIVGIGLFLNSLLPIGYGIVLVKECFALTLEAFRLGGMVVSVLHLLMLAVNHYLGIIRPLHYASTMTRGVAMISILIMWYIPIIGFFFYFLVVPDQGLQSEGCKKWYFLTYLKFRWPVASAFFLPLAPMCVMYVHMFMVVRRHHRGLAQYQPTAQINRNVKATITTLLILGTYVVGWLPAVISYLLLCTDCAYHAYSPSTPDSTENLSLIPSFSIIVTANALIIFKALVNPIVYVARMKEISAALYSMYQSCFLCRESTPVRVRNDTITTSIRGASIYCNKKGGESVLNKGTPPIKTRNGQEWIPLTVTSSLSNNDHTTNGGGVQI